MVSKLFDTKNLLKVTWNVPLSHDTRKLGLRASPLLHQSLLERIRLIDHNLCEAQESLAAILRLLKLGSST
ncbi:uncharacterized protein PHALS_13139 [Plasmopara halstedii]|uniref:Uncharacterized protein n=1 Tax=Plasmopara halstedii TaxID=4781 RepID=A0A0P1ANW3_PLAHL|nr:uncharacterized protein PHALS_13139 [Plasmopara halstedii]CEG42903.1 hypothetical protein PHALS_13139 [Plasmopara halstedii]|eukprot:XP_024579272.1 hypothetical protein PHALS_13139 [Plasmopara halstedii]